MNTYGLGCSNRLLTFGLGIQCPGELTSPAGSGYPVIYYETIPKKTLKQLVRRMARRKEKPVLTPHAKKLIVEALIAGLPESEIEQKMIQFQITRELAIDYYRITLHQLIEDEDLAIILILLNV